MEQRPIRQEAPSTYVNRWKRRGAAAGAVLGGGLFSGGIAFLESVTHWDVNTANALLKIVSEFTHVQGTLFNPNLTIVLSGLGGSIGGGIVGYMAGRDFGRKHGVRTY